MSQQVDLQNFVTETLKQLIDGVAEAQEHAKQRGAYVNPVGLSGGSSRVYMQPFGWMTEVIEFDIAVTATDSDSVRGGVGLFVGPIGGGTQAQTEGSNSTVNRIRFSIPVLFPRQQQAD